MKSISTDRCSRGQVTKSKTDTPFTQGRESP